MFFYGFIINGWLFVLEIWVTVLFSYESKILETLNWKVVSSAACLHFSFVTQECLQTVELLCSCYWTIHLVHHFDRYRQQPGILLIFRSHWADRDCVTVTQSDKTLSYSDSAVNIFDYSDRLLIKASHTFIFTHQAFNTSHRRRDTLDVIVVHCDSTSLIYCRAYCRCFVRTCKCTWLPQCRLVHVSFHWLYNKKASSASSSAAVTTAKLQLK